MKDQQPSVLRCASVAQSVGSLESICMVLLTATADTLRTTCSGTCGVIYGPIGVASRARIVTVDRNTDILGHIRGRSEFSIDTSVLNIDKSV